MTIDCGLARNSDPETSHDAAEKVNVSWLQAKVLEALDFNGPMTAEQVADYLGISQQSITPRFRPLAEKGAIVDTGSKHKNKSGRFAILWRAVKK